MDHRLAFGQRRGLFCTTGSSLFRLRHVLLAERYRTQRFLLGLKFLLYAILDPSENRFSLREALQLRIRSAPRPVLLLPQ